MPRAHDKAGKEGTISAECGVRSAEWGKGMVLNVVRSEFMVFEKLEVGSRLIADGC